jgi:hypothetical protein
MTRHRWIPTGRQAAYALAILLGLAVATDGFVSSFNNLATYATAHRWPWGPALPLGLDLGIPALLLLDWLRSSVFLRGAAWSLTAWTVFANGAVAGGTPVDKLLHAMMPAVAVVIIEAARHLRGDPARMDRIRLSRWVLSPLRTPRLWRRMVLWEIRSYSEALVRESAILHARTVLAAAYGHRTWARTRRHVPPSLAHQLATGQLPHMVLHSLDLQGAVRDWVRGTLADLAAQPAMDLPQTAGTEQPEPGDSGAPARGQWDLIWDLRDALRPDGVSARTFAQAIGLARDHFEQVGKLITNQDLQVCLGGAKDRVNAIGRVLRTSYEAGPDLADQTQDYPAPAADAEEPAGTYVDLAVGAGPNGRAVAP